MRTRLFNSFRADLSQTWTAMIMQLLPFLDLLLHFVALKNINLFKEHLKVFKHKLSIQFTTTHKYILASAVRLPDLKVSITVLGIICSS